MSGPFLLPPAPAARRALLRALRFRAEASPALEGAHEGVQAPERVQGPGLEGGGAEAARRSSRASGLSIRDRPAVAAPGARRDPCFQN